MLDVCELEDTAPRRPSCRCRPRRVCLTFRVSCPVLGPQSRRMVTCHSQGRHSQLLWWTDSEAAPRPPLPDVHAPCEPLPTCDLLSANGIGQRRWDVTFTSMLHKITTSICWKLLPLQALMKLGTVVGAHVARADGTSEPESGHPPTARKKPRHSEGDRDRGRQRERESERETVRET